MTDPAKDQTPTVKKGEESTLVKTPEPSPAPTSASPATGSDDDPDNLREGIQFFAGSITKLNRNGDLVLSDHVGPGESRV